MTAELLSDEDMDEAIRFSAEDEVCEHGVKLGYMCIDCLTKEGENEHPQNEY